MDINSRAKRVLNHLRNYHETTFITEETLDFLALQDREKCLGIYENVPGILQESVFITNKGLYFFEEDKKKFLAYDDIIYIKPLRNKQKDINIEVNMTNGDTIFLPIKGSRGPFKDVYEFSRFLHRVIDDIKRFPGYTEIHEK